VTLSLLGGGMLWFGWFGFNAGSALGAGEVATVAFVATNTAAASAMLCWLLLESVFKGKPTAVGGITGAVAGLVAITPACGFVTPMGAVAIGFLVSVVCYWTLNRRVQWGLDDTLDAFSVHGIGGIVGALATGFFATTAVNPGGADGVFAGNPSQLGVQALAVAATVVYSGVVTWLLLAGLRRVLDVRSDGEHEHEGLDLVEHGERAYHELIP
jgi:Amt family ammonium transporter